MFFPSFFFSLPPLPLSEAAEQLFCRVGSRVFLRRKAPTFDIAGHYITQSVAKA
jgi:hypothetical protein